MQSIILIVFIFINPSKIIFDVIVVIAIFAKHNFGNGKKI